MKKLIASNEATLTKKQHTTPCSDCPWRRDSLKGWLGDNTAEEWIGFAHSEVIVDCHTKKSSKFKSHQCAGMAIYRRNVCKVPRFALRLEKNKEKVFITPNEFLEHHKIK